MVCGGDKSLLFKLLLVFVFVALPAVVQAQSIEITPFGGWQFGGGFGTQEGLVDIDADVVYGVSLDVRIREDGLLELIYSRQETNLTVRSDHPFDPFQTVRRISAVSVEYYQGGGVFEFYTENPALRPFVVLTAGVTRLRPEAGRASGGSPWEGAAG